jgi:hypothetical protein
MLPTTVTNMRTQGYPVVANCAPKQIITVNGVLLLGAAGAEPGRTPTSAVTATALWKRQDTRIVSDHTIECRGEVYLVNNPELAQYMMIIRITPSVLQSIRARWCSQFGHAQIRRQQGGALSKTGPHLTQIIPHQPPDERIYDSLAEISEDNMV